MVKENRFNFLKGNLPKKIFPYFCEYANIIASQIVDKILLIIFNVFHYAYTFVQYTHNTKPPPAPPITIKDQKALNFQNDKLVIKVYKGVLKMLGVIL